MTGRVAVIGGGISGIACAAALTSTGVPVTVFDRGYRVGGRLATSTLRDTQTPWDGRVVDVGASYFTAHDEGFAAVVAALVAEDVIRPWTDTVHVANPQGVIGPKLGPMRYSAIAGLRSVVQALADQLPQDLVSFAHPVDVGPIESTPRGVLVGDEVFDSAAVCMPDPQAARLLTHPSVANAQELLVDAPTWEPVMALTTVYDRDCWAPFDAMFVNDDAAITFIANDGSRRGDGAPVLVTHSSAPAALAHLGDPIAAAPIMLAALAQVLRPSADPSWFTVKRWTYARPISARSRAFGLATTEHGAFIGCGGDSWAGGPRTETAWLSGTELGRELARVR